MHWALHLSFGQGFGEGKASATRLITSTVLVCWSPYTTEFDPWVLLKLSHKYVQVQGVNKIISSSTSQAFTVSICLFHTVLSDWVTPQMTHFWCDTLGRGKKKLVSLFKVMRDFCSTFWRLHFISGWNFNEEFCHPGSIKSVLQLYIQLFII